MPAQKKRLLSTDKPDFMDSKAGTSTPEALFMDECGKNPDLSTTMAVYMDGEARLSTPEAVYVDKWQ